MWKLTAVAILCFASTAFAADPPSPDKFQVIGQGICEDVGLPCVKLVLKETDLYYAIFREGKLVAITKLKPDGREEVIWGDIKLPPKPGEHNI